MMPKKLNDWYHNTRAPGFSWLPVEDNQEKTTNYKIHIGPFGKRIVKALKSVVITLAQSEHYLVIDDISFGKEQVEQWQEALQDFNVLWIGVTAPLEELEQREKDRGNRKLGSTKWQVEHVHKAVEYDLNPWNNFFIYSYLHCMEGFVLQVISPLPVMAWMVS